MTPTLGGRRRPLVIALGVLVVALLVALGVTQVRADRAAAARADEARAAAAAQVAAEAARESAVREAGAVHAARHGQAQARELGATLASVAPREAAAQAVLDASAGRVADDAVRAALQSALDALRTGVAAAAQGTVTSASLLAAADAVDAASASVAAAQAEWEAAAATAPAPDAPTATATARPRAAAPAEEPAPAAGGRPTDAAGNVLWVTSVPTADGDGSNGNMPMSAMCRIPWGTDQLGYAQYLRCDAADALTRLEAAFRATFGESIAMDLTYRSYADQVAMKQALGPIAARPGTSSHGLGTALDVQEWPDVYGFGTARYEWLVAHGPTYGWYAPARVRADAAYPEYWHFEYGPGRTS
ncbi:M15 family metallopeptidase [Cellulomonas sp. NS3]|uniref:M15 family metallopeptidase n=1 Tax=Cellulomonas sp. NS3 TaxID=2973977 RepID=UPI00216259C6|nr:M15 family metallopeptidase [Cellulomonas sp. NS3]